MTTSDVMVFDPERRTNARLVVDLVRLGYLAPDLATLDPTYGLGAFWRSWRPTDLVATDLDPTRSPGAVVDFTAMPWPDESFDRVVFDPPYKLNGTSTGAGCAASDASYGVATAASAADRHDLIRLGIDECVRVLRRRGLLLLKVQDQVNGGRKRWQTIEMASHAIGLGCELVDQLHVAGHRPQPTGRRQAHARQNYSTLLVLRRKEIR